MAKHRVAFLSSGNSDLSLVEEGLKGLDCDLTVHTTSSDGETIEAIKGADVIILNSGKMPRQVIEEIDTAKAIISGGHGFDPIDDGAATEKGIMVINSAGFCTEEVSNHVMMLLLACAKKLTMLDGLMKAGSWGSQDGGANSTQTGRGESMPPVYGQTLGLIALGNIGRATARKAKVFGLEVIAYDPYVPEWTARECGVDLVSSLNELASRSDFVSLHTPLNNETRKLVGESFFKAMRRSAYFINTSRGGTADEQALIAALQSGEIAGAGLDVFEQEPTPADNPLLKMDNVIVTPHTAGSSVDSTAASLRRVGEEAARVLKGTWPMSLVNPEVRARIPMRSPAVNP